MILIHRFVELKRYDAGHAVAAFSILRLIKAISRTGEKDDQRSRHYLETIDKNVIFISHRKCDLRPVSVHAVHVLHTTPP